MLESHAMLTSPLDPDVANIPKLQALLNKLATDVDAMTSPAQDFKVIVEALLKRTEERLDRLVCADKDMSLPMMAYAARNLLELSIWTTYILASNENTKRTALKVGSLNVRHFLS